MAWARYGAPFVCGGAARCFIGGKRVSRFNKGLGGWRCCLPEGVVPPPLSLAGLIRLLRGLLAAVCGAEGGSGWLRLLCAQERRGGGGEWGAGLCLLRGAPLPQPPGGGGGPLRDRRLGLGALSPAGEGRGPHVPPHLGTWKYPRWVFIAGKAGGGAAPPPQGEVGAWEQKLRGVGREGGKSPRVFVGEGGKGILPAPGSGRP